MASLTGTLRQTAAAELPGHRPVPPEVGSVSATDPHGFHRGREISHGDGEAQLSVPVERAEQRSKYALWAPEVAVIPRDPLHPGYFRIKIAGRNLLAEGRRFRRIRRCGEETDEVFVGSAAMSANGSAASASISCWCVRTTTRTEVPRSVATACSIAVAKLSSGAAALNATFPICR